MPYRYGSDTALLVLASEPYDADNQIRDGDVFLQEQFAIPGV